MKINAEGNTEFDRFDNVMNDLLSVPHAAIEGKLKAEARKKVRRKKRLTSSVSHVAVGKD